MPAFTDAATIFVPEPLLAPMMMSQPAGRGSVTVVRRLAARLAGQPPAVTDSVPRPGEVRVGGPLGAAPAHQLRIRPAQPRGAPTRSRISCTAH